MIIPERIKIGGLVYEVNQTEYLKYGEDFIGEVIYLDLKINLKPVEVELMKQTLLHEICHIICSHLGYEKLEKDEQFIEGFSQSFYAFIIDNPEMFKEE